MGLRVRFIRRIFVKNYDSTEGTVSSKCVLDGGRGMQCDAIEFACIPSLLAIRCQSCQICISSAPHAQPCCSCDLVVVVSNLHPYSTRVQVPG